MHEELAIIRGEFAETGWPDGPLATLVTGINKSLADPRPSPAMPMIAEHPNLICMGCACAIFEVPMFMIPGDIRLERQGNDALIVHSKHNSRWIGALALIFLVPWIRNMPDQSGLALL